MNKREEESLREFGDALQEWSGQPPARSAGEAVGELQGQLEATGFDSRLPLRFGLVGLFTLALLVGIWFRPQPGEGVPQVSSEAPALAIEHNQLLFWLDAETPLYMELGSPGD